MSITKEWIIGIIQNFVSDSPLKTTQNGTDELSWDQVLVGFASGADQIWQQYKKYMGPFHWTPWEVLNQHAPEQNVSAGCLTIISWILPQGKFVRKTNR